MKRKVNPLPIGQLETDLATYKKILLSLFNPKSYNEVVVAQQKGLCLGMLRALGYSYGEALDTVDSWISEVTK